MAMACLGFVTLSPLRPLLSFPSFIAFISVSTLFEAAGEYFRADDFFAVLFFAVAVAAISILLVDSNCQLIRMVMVLEQLSGGPNFASKIRPKMSAEWECRGGSGAAIGKKL
jgi:hypothetical protein